MAWKEFLSWLRSEGITLISEKEIPYGKQLALQLNSEKIFFNWYTTGKVSIQGKDSVLKTKISSYWGKADTNTPSSKEQSKGDFDRYIGSDESGKGDYFGPLVVSCVFVPKSKEKELLSLGIKDSKKLSEAKIITLAKEIKKYCKYEYIILSPIEYNYIYQQEKNLNKILVKLHTEINTALAKQVKAEGILIDQFTSQEFLLQKSLASTGLPIAQRFRAEEYLPVACASILARYFFVEAMDNLSKKWDLYLPKGASLEVEDAAKTFIHQNGAKAMLEVAKIHFATSKKIGLTEDLL